MNFFLYFFLFLLKTLIAGSRKNRLIEAILTSLEPPHKGGSNEYPRFMF